MAGFLCHAFAGAKRFRLERIVRRHLANVAATNHAFLMFHVFNESLLDSG